MIKEDEPKTPKEKMMAKIGYKASDDKVDHMATGIVASVLLVISIAVVVALDSPLLIAHLQDDEEERLLRHKEVQVPDYRLSREPPRLR